MSIPVSVKAWQVLQHIVLVHVWEICHIAVRAYQHGGTTNDKHPQEILCPAHESWLLQSLSILDPAMPSASIMPATYPISLVYVWEGSSMSSFQNVPIENQAVLTVYIQVSQGICHGHSDSYPRHSIRTYAHIRRMRSSKPLPLRYRKGVTNLQICSQRTCLLTLSVACDRSTLTLCWILSSSRHWVLYHRSQWDSQRFQFRHRPIMSKPFIQSVQAHVSSDVNSSKRYSLSG